MFDIDRHDDTSPAPGDLEVLQRFLNLHEHDAEGITRDPPLEMVRAFLVARGLLAPEERLTDTDRETYLELRRAMRALIESGDGPTLSPEDAEVIDRLGAEAELHPHFHAGHVPTLEPRGGGATAAFGKIVAIAFVASFDGRFAKLKTCADEGCRAVFFDRSRNHSGRWCSMEACGNRAKVRAWRERQKAAP